VKSDILTLVFFACVFSSHRMFTVVRLQASTCPLPGLEGKNRLLEEMEPPKIYKIAVANVNLDGSFERGLF